LDLIRNYFGEQFAFYFAWSGFNIRIFAVLAVFGILAKIGKINYPHFSMQRTVIETSFLAMMVAVGSFYTLGWARYENWFSAHWDCKEGSRDKVARADYRGDFQRDPMDENGKQIRMYPMWKTVLAKGFGVVLTIVYMLFTVACVSYIYAWRPYVIETYGTIGKYAASAALSLQIMICNMVWRKIVSGLVWLENPRTATQYYQAFVWKQFVFQFFNAYQSFLYFLFVGPFRGSCPPVSDMHDNVFEDCCAYARSSLYSTFASYGFFAFLGMVQPWVLQQIALYLENRKLKKQGNDKIERSFMERQSKMYIYDQETQVADFLELIIIAGYVLMFGVLAPMTSIIAMLFFVVRLRVDAWKLIVVYRRPYPMNASGIGEWKSVIKTLTWIGMAVNVAVICLQLKWPSGEAMHWHEKYIAFFLVEHAMILVKTIIDFTIAPVSSYTELLVDRREYVIDRLIMGKVDYKMKIKNPEEYCLPRRAEDALTLVDGRIDWNEVDHDNDMFSGKPRENFHDYV